MAELTPNLAMDYLLESQASGETTHNEALNVLDALVQGKIKTRDINTPPGGESDGEGWLIGDSPTGAWAGHAEEVTFYYAGYIFWTPWEGLLLWVIDENQHIFYDGMQWIDMGSEWKNIICCAEVSPALEDPSGAAIPVWSTPSSPSPGDYVRPTTPGHYVFECIVGGTGSGVEPTWPTTLGEDIAEGPNTLVWRTRGLNVIEMTLDLTGKINPYEALRYTVDGNLRHGVVKSITATRIFLIGAPLWADTDMTTLEHGQDPAKVVQWSFNVPGNYNSGGDTSALLSDVLDMRRTWRGPDAAIVSLVIFNKTDDTGEAPHVNLLKVGAEVIAEGDSPEPGVQIDTSGATHHEVAIHGEAGTINKMAWGNVLEFRLDHVDAGNNDDAVGFNAEVTFVLH